MVTGIFLMVVLAALAAFAVNVSRVQHTSSSLDVLGARAYAAAQSGIEWGTWQVLRNGGACAASTNLALPGTAAGFVATVGCVSTTHCEGAVCPPDNITIYQLTATACNQPAAGACPNGAPGEGYVERQVVATVER